MMISSRRSILATIAAAAGTVAFGAPAARAQAPSLIPSQRVQSPTSARRATRTIFIVGDSTSSVYAHAERPRAGWGQALPLFLGPQVRAFDFALSGASSKSYADTGLLEQVLGMIQDGDYLLISFGHNDQKIEDPARGTDPATTFKEYLRRYLDGATARGAKPVLLTPVERRRFDATGKAGDSHGRYPQAIRELAAATGTPLVDLTTASRELWQDLGPEGTKTHFLHAGPGEHPQYPAGVADNTHFQARGAVAIAGLVVDGLKEVRAVPRGYFRVPAYGTDPLTAIYWPADRPVEAPLVLEVGRGKAYSSVQAAVDAAPSGGTQRTIIKIAPGTYRETIRVPSNKPKVSFVGLGADPQDVLLVYNNASGTPKPDGSGPFGTGGSASVRIDGAEFSAQNLTFSNDFDEAANMSMANRQAVALHITADRSLLTNIRCLGNQDTLLVDSPSRGVQARFLFTDSYIAGDVDFIFGRGTAVFSNCEIDSLDRRSSNNGYISAGSINERIKHGYLFDGCRIVSSAAAGTVHLGRPWHPSGDLEAVAQVLIRDSWLGAHIKSTPWADMSGFSWKEARFFEFNNRGPGGRITADRPQLPAAQESNYTLAAYLAGADGWAPQLAETRADSTVLV